MSQEDNEHILIVNVAIQGRLNHSDVGEYHKKHYTCDREHAMKGIKMAMHLL
jgi:hypothetical protein